MRGAHAPRVLRSAPPLSGGWKDPARLIPESTPTLSPAKFPTRATETTREGACAPPSEMRSATPLSAGWKDPARLIPESTPARSPAMFPTRASETTREGACAPPSEMRSAPPLSAGWKDPVRRIPESTPALSPAKFPTRATLELTVSNARGRPKIAATVHPPASCWHALMSSLPEARRGISSTATMIRGHQREVRP